MQLFLDIIISLILLLIVFQDLKSQSVYVWAFPLLFGFMIWKSFLVLDAGVLWDNLMINAGFIILQFVCL